MIDQHLAGAAVPGDVREALLRDAVHDQLGVRVERGDVRLDLPDDRDAGPPREPAPEVAQGAGQGVD